jgi:hypothetical protein
MALICLLVRGVVARDPLFVLAVVLWVASLFLTTTIGDSAHRAGTNSEGLDPALKKA